MKLRTKLTLVFLLVCLIPLLATVVVTYNSARAAMQTQVLEQLQSLAMAQKNRTVAIISLDLQSLSFLSATPQLLADLNSYEQQPSAATQTGMNASLTGVLPIIPTIKAISVLNTEGETVFST